MNLSLDENFESDTNFRIGVKLIKQKKGKDGLKVGYVEFESVAATEIAHGSGNVEIGGVQRSLHYARRRNHRKDNVAVSSKKIYISGIPNDVDENELSDLLGECKISGTDNGKSYIFAEYESNEKQKKALEKLNNIQFMNSRLFATPAYERAHDSGRFDRRRGEVD